MADPAIRHMTLAEFLRWEDGTDTRYELIWGVPVAIVPPAGAHGVLCVRLGVGPDPRLCSRRPCMAHTEAGIVRPDREDAYYVADLAVTCSPYRRGQRFVRDPILIVEILAPSTERHDRRTKLPVYCDIESVKRSCSSTRKVSTPKILRYVGDRWITELVQGRETMIRLSSVDLRVAMVELYEGIDFDADDAA